MNGFYDDKNFNQKHLFIDSPLHVNLSLKWDRISGQTLKTSCIFFSSVDEPTNLGLIDGRYVNYSLYDGMLFNSFTSFQVTFKLKEIPK